MIIIITIFIVIAVACCAWVLHQMIQEGQILGKWQIVLGNAYRINPFLEMFLGGCYKCFAHFIGILSFPAYLAIQYQLCWIGYWNVLMYVGYVSMVIVVAMFIDKYIKQ